MEIGFALLIALVSVIVGGLLTWFFGRIQEFRLVHKLKDAVIDRERISVGEEFLMTQILAEKVEKGGGKPDIIYAIFPGGAMVAEWLSRRFWGKRSDSIPVQLLHMKRNLETGSARNDVAEIDTKLTATQSGLAQDSKVLIVNDMSRSGFTLDAARKFLSGHFQDENIQSATLICYKDAAVKPTHHVAVTGKTVRFDWKSYS